MAILHNCAQRSDRWTLLRLGIPTSSGFKMIWTPPQKPTPTGRAPKHPLGRESTSWETYAHELLYERITGEKEPEEYRGRWMLQGEEREPDAVQWYELANDVDTTEIGFITTDDWKIGCSPDRLAGDDGLVEFKSPKGGTHVGYSLQGKLDQDYWVQLQGQLYVSERKWVDIVSYHPKLVNLKVCIRVERDEDYIGALASGLRGFNHYLDGVSARYCPDWMEDKKKALASIPPKAALKDALRASLGHETTWPPPGAM
jgi:hypothetical protein